MEVPEVVNRTLVILENKLSFETFEALVHSTFDILSGTAGDDVLLALDGNVALIKQGYAALASIIVESARLNNDPQELKTYLDDNDVSEERIEVIVDTYTKSFRPIRAVLASTSFNYNHIVDIQWRFDFLVKTDTIERLNVPIFFITLKTINTEGKPEDINFTATQQQLQDFLAVLNDAKAALGRLDLFKAIN